MSALKDVVIERALDTVRVAYLDRTTARWWNERKRSEDTAMFCGWYWSHGRGEEAGPFKTRSAAIRDAYYRFVLNREPPTVQIGRNGSFHTPNVKRVA